MTDETRNNEENTMETAATPDAAILPAQTEQNDAPIADLAEISPVEAEPSPEDMAKAAWLKEHAPTLAKWLMVLFWLGIARFVCNGFENTIKLPKYVPVTGLVLSAATYLISLLQIFAAWKLQKAERKFRMLALINAASTVFLAITQVTLGGADPAVIAGIVSDRTQRAGVQALVAVLLALALGLAAVVYYFEMTAFHNVTRYVDEELAEKWLKLRTWMIGLTAATFAAILLGILIAGNPFAYFNGWGTVILLLAVPSSLGMLVCSVILMVYLYRTAKLFKTTAQNIDNTEGKVA